MLLWIRRVIRFVMLPIRQIFITVRVQIGISNRLKECAWNNTIYADGAYGEELKQAAKKPMATGRKYLQR